jgi:hypothetical protein
MRPSLTCGGGVYSEKLGGWSWWEHAQQDGAAEEAAGGVLGALREGAGLHGSKAAVRLRWLPCIQLGHGMQQVPWLAPGQIGTGQLAAQHRLLACAPSLA